MTDEKVCLGPLDRIVPTRGLLVSKRARMVDTLENILSGGRQEEILAATLAAASVRPGEALLDVGCGTGKLAIAAAALVGESGRVSGIDATPEMISLATKRATSMNSRAEFRVGIGEDLPFKSYSQDAVTSSYFFHHLPSDLKRIVLHEMWRVLKPGGRLIITDYSRPQSLLGYIASIPMRFDFHEYVRSQLRGELERIIEEEGFGPAIFTATFLGYINVIRLVKR